MNNVTVLDNFYSNPDKIISMLTGDYPIHGCGTGNRSIPLQEMNHRLYEDFCNGIFHIHNLNPSGLFVTTFFMEHEASEVDVFNKKWIHIDGKNPDVCMSTMDEYNLILCGQIFLTSEPDPEAGVKICELKPEIQWTEKELIDNTINFYTQPRELYDVGKITLDEYIVKHTDYHNNFNLTCDIKNKYNRMVSWKGKTLHGDPITKKMPKRLTQYFFIRKV
jgi:hypothetical protein